MEKNILKENMRRFRTKNLKEGPPTKEVDLKGYTPEEFLDELDDIRIEDIDTNDYPDFVDAFVWYAEIDGKPLNDEQLDWVNDQGEWLHPKILDYLQ